MSAQGDQVSNPSLRNLKVLSLVCTILPLCLFRFESFTYIFYVDIVLIDENYTRFYISIYNYYYFPLKTLNYKL